MACKQEADVVAINTGTRNENDNVEEEKPGDLENNIEIVVGTWALVKQDLLKHGTVFYIRLLTEHPELKHLFSFAENINAENMEDDPGLQRQAKLLMSMIDNAVRSLGDLEELIPKLKRLGKRHFAKYNVKPEYFQSVGECLLWTLKEGLGEIFTNEVDKAWTAIYSIVADVMIAGGTEATSNGPSSAEEK